GRGRRPPCAPCPFPAWEGLGLGSGPRCGRKSERKLSMTNPKFDVDAARARCRKFRKRILDISQTVGALHIAPAFSCLELVDTAYLGLMNRTGNPDTSDTFLLSKGHGSPALFCVLEELGVFPRAYLENFCKPGWPLSTHPDFGT